MDFALVFIIGSVIGSFLNVCIYRIPRGESISYPPSHCTNCNKKIKPYDLIPILSYIILNGKCRYCGEKISMEYPIIEFINGILFTAIYLKYGIGFVFIKNVILLCFLIVIGMIDYKTTDVYTVTTWSGIIIGVFLAILGYYWGYDYKQYLFGGALGVGFIASIILLTHGMGWGDAEICALCGVFLGVKYTLLMLFIAVLIAAVSGTILILLKIKSRKDYIPLGPSIASSAIIVILFGSNILLTYYNYFLI